MEEIWKIFVYKGSETKYFGSNVGNVGRIWNGEIKILKPSTDKKGYKVVGLHINGKRINISVHRIIAMCFLPNLNNYPQVNHIKGKEKYNNSVSNLEWCTGQHNVAEAWRTGLCTAKGEKHRNAKITEAIVIEIFRLYNVEKWTLQRIADYFGIGKSQVHRILRRESWGWFPIPPEYL